MAKPEETSVAFSNTYEWVLRKHVFADPDQPRDWPYQQPAWVFTSRPLSPVPGAAITFASGDIAAVFSNIREAASGKSIWIVGAETSQPSFMSRICWMRSF